MRLFLALDLPDPVRRALLAWRPALPGARWTPHERLHLTLYFLGETDPVVAQSLTEALQSFHAPPVSIGTTDLLRLPSARKPRVLAVGVADSPELTALHARLGHVLAEVGAPAGERPLLPHVTLARFRSPDPAGLRRFLREASPPRARGVARSISLVQSQPGAGGPVYTTHLRVGLG